MSEQQSIDLILYLGFFAIFGGGMIIWLKILFRQRREEVEAMFREEEIILQHNFAHFYGLESIGHAQAKGNGVLVMTSKELYFLKALPRREYRVPLSAITQVSNPRSHLGKSNVTKLLRVDFIRDGKVDAIAWMVGEEFETWTQAVQEARKALKG